MGRNDIDSHSPAQEMIDRLAVNDLIFKAGGSVDMLIVQHFQKKDHGVCRGQITVVVEVLVP